MYEREVNEMKRAVAVNTNIRKNQMITFPKVVAPLGEKPKLSQGMANRLAPSTAEKTP